MDVPPENTLPNPYSDNASSDVQPASLARPHHKFVGDGHVAIMIRRLRPSEQTGCATAAGSTSGEWMELVGVIAGAAI